MIAGPIFGREALTLPRHVAHFAMRAGYVAILFVLAYTAGQATFGWQTASSVGELSRFGSQLFQLFSLVQLALVLFFAPLFAAGRVAQEKDRQTLILLLMTDLRDRELVFGKLLASLLPVAVLVLVSAPVFFTIALWGGVSTAQILWALAISAATAFTAGSWGTLVAFWREKTFQTLAISVLGLVLFLGVIEAAIAIAGPGPFEHAIGILNPFRGMLLVLDPLAAQPGLKYESVPAWPYVLALVSVGLLLNGITIGRLRIWNPSRQMAAAVTSQEEARAAAERAVRKIWDWPVLWREIRTRAYGRKVVLIKLAYLVMFAFAASYAWNTLGSPEKVLGMIAPYGAAFVGVTFITLLLVNTQAVTSITTERDAKTLELLLVTDVTAREFIFGKLAGVMYNAKEILIPPLFAIGYLTWLGVLSGEACFYLMTGFLVLATFAAMLGVHFGLSWDSSRSAIANSLGTMFFLFLGIFVCILLIVEARANFLMQLPSFLAFIIGGAIGLLATLTRKNPSPALSLAALALPFFTFYAIVDFLMNGSLGLWIVICTAYGFTTIAMLVPAISEFDVALGRSTLDKG